MSSAGGKVRFNDGMVMYFRYDGTCDICQSQLFETEEERNTKWRKEDDFVAGNYKWESVIIANNYAYGYYWEGKATKEGWIHPDSLIPYDYQDDGTVLNKETEGLPDWFYEDEDMEDLG